MTEIVEVKLDRMRAFWERAEVDRPLLGVDVRSMYPTEAMADLPVNQPLRPDDLKPERFLPWYERQHAANAGLPGSLLWSAAPLWNFPWLEAIAGCEVMSSGDTLWAEAPATDDFDLPSRQAPQNNPWLAKLLEFHVELVVQARGRYPVGLPLLRGPADLAAALRGTQRLALDLYDDRAGAVDLLSQCTNLWLAAVRAQVMVIPPWHGGYGLPLRGLWAPGPGAQAQNDAGFLFSPALYKEVMLPYDRQAAGLLPYSYMHLHSGQTHILDDLLAMSELRCIELTMDVGGPTVAEMLPTIVRMQASKPTIVQGWFTPADVAAIVSAVPPAGLCVVAHCDDRESAQILAEAAGLAS
ncbi:MAG: uroporphyrinogen decarboxylase/cobalamine-independent methonine synthase family protein [Chloroflexota bacterium]